VGAPHPPRARFRRHPPPPLQVTNASPLV
jgi:hypothetical protein